MIPGCTTTEGYFRELIVTISNGVMFVCNKFNLSTQERVITVINQINSQQGSDLQKISPDNRLLVIHNHMEVFSPADLQRPTKVRIYQPI